MTMRPKTQPLTPPCAQKTDPRIAATLYLSLECERWLAGLRTDLDVESAIAEWRKATRRRVAEIETRAALERLVAELEARGGPITVARLRRLLDRF
jgi:hypothetical protein